MGVKVAASLFIGQNVLINPSMADLDALALLHPSRYLFRTPIFSQFLFYHFPGRHRDPWLGFRPATDRFLMCLLWTIAALTCIPMQLSTDGGSVHFKQKSGIFVPG